MVSRIPKHQQFSTNNNISFTLVSSFILFFSLVLPNKQNSAKVPVFIFSRLYATKYPTLLVHPTINAMVCWLVGFEYFRMVFRGFLRFLGVSQGFLWFSLSIFLRFIKGVFLLTTTIAILPVDCFNSVYL